MKKLINNRQASMAATIAIIIIVAVAAVGGVLWFLSFYSIPAGSVGVVTDQVGGIVRIEKGPLGWASKSLWESVIQYSVMVRTEDMKSPTSTVDGITRVNPAPLEPARYGAISVDTLDVSNVYIDITVQWHLDSESIGWQDGISSLYLNYPSEDYDTKTVLPAVRDYVRNLASTYTLQEIAHTKRVQFSDNVTNYVQTELDKLETLNGIVQIDKIFVRRIIPPEDVQRAYQQVLTAEKEAEAIITLANAQREAAITVAEGQAYAIERVTNATSTSIMKLLGQNVSVDNAIDYLKVQYIYDQLRSIARENPDWKLTIFIDTPETQVVLPLEQEP